MTIMNWDGRIFAFSDVADYYNYELQARERREERERGEMRPKKLNENSCHQNQASKQAGQRSDLIIRYQLSLLLSLSAQLNSALIMEERV